jgi:hypothetical protein
MPQPANSSLAHEIAHILLGHEPSIMFVMPQSEIVLRTHNKEQEDDANWALRAASFCLERRFSAPDV